MIEKLFGIALSRIRNYVNEKRKNDEDEVKTVLQNIISRIDYLSEGQSDVKEEKDTLIQEMTRLSKTVFTYGNNIDINKQKMQRNIDTLAWVNKKIAINKSGRKYTVAQREIFYAQLGNNIGSEQNGTRPVIVLQNDTGNRKGNTTIVAPITTHQKQIQYDVQKHRYYVEREKEGKIVKKYLDFYEVPLRLEGNANGLYGFVNVMHIRAIDRKRIDSKCMGKATEKCFNNVLNAISRNLQA